MSRLLFTMLCVSGAALCADECFVNKDKLQIEKQKITSRDIIKIVQPYLIQGNWEKAAFILSQRDLNNYVNSEDDKAAIGVLQAVSCFALNNHKAIEILKTECEHDVTLSALILRVLGQEGKTKDYTTEFVSKKLSEEQEECARNYYEILLLVRRQYIDFCNGKWERVIDSFEDNGTFFVATALALVGRYDESIEIFDKIASENSWEEADCLIHKALVYFLKGDSQTSASLLLEATKKEMEDYLENPYLSGIPKAPFILCGLKQQSSFGQMY